jgi:hypothetical protein
VITEANWSKITIRHTILSKYWHVETLKVGKSNLVLKDYSSSEFLLLKSLNSPRKIKIPPIVGDKLLPPILKATQNIWDVRMDNSDSDRDRMIKNNYMVVANGLEISFSGNHRDHRWAQARASHGL